MPSGANPAPRHTVARWTEASGRASVPLVAAALPLLVLLLLPIVAVATRAVEAPSWRELWQPSTRAAVALSLGTTLTTTALAVVLGTPLALLLARRRFRGRRLLEAAVELPMVLPPAVAGIALLLVFGRRGLIGSWLDSVGLGVAFTPVAVVLAQLFVAAPFFVKTASVGIASVEPELEAAAAVDGATPWQVFWRVTMPLARRALVGGAALCWARALGEFGATIIFAGNYPGRTQTMPLAIYLGFETSLGQAIVLSTLLLVVSLAVLLVTRALLDRGGGESTCAGAPASRR
jgi:molybdate transport system permease protein